MPIDIETGKLTNMFRGEQLFRNLLCAAELDYQFHKPIRIHGVKVRTPDFYLPFYDVYIEVVSNRQTLDRGTLSRLKRVISAGFNITFYYHTGDKIIFTENVLNQLGLFSNDEIFSIPELEKDEE